MAKKKTDPPKHIVYRILVDAKKRTCEIEDCEARVAAGGTIDFEVVVSGKGKQSGNLRVHFSIDDPPRHALRVGAFRRRDLDFKGNAWKQTAVAVSGDEYDVSARAFFGQGPPVEGTCRAEAESDDKERTRPRMIIVG